ncbi:hypothetical protein JYU29_10380 [Tianweitania sp. BSSL-BM11]|uniref:Uncharacterized protein n=1 Tax=Tianweitania aestuarii TaxID=2814886 RepID=A0ABS5RZL0_9HYPH|nr:DUF6665 family protein [Tianweitania aestuarii]MBS9721092.1 hypothetical protein [Tianweitania aestuarii]
MSLRPPSQFGNMHPGDVLFDALNTEIAGEKATALGRAGTKAAKALAALAEAGPDHPDRPALLKAAADAVHGFFIQRELCGMRRHDGVIRDLAIPQAVLVRMGAK